MDCMYCMYSRMCTVHMWVGERERGRDERARGEKEREIEEREGGRVRGGGREREVNERYCRGDAERERER